MGTESWEQGRVSLPEPSVVQGLQVVALLSVKYEAILFLLPFSSSCKSKFSKFHSTLQDSVCQRRVPELEKGHRTL